MSPACLVVALAACMFAAPAAEAGTLTKVGSEYRYTEATGDTTNNVVRMDFCPSATTCATPDPAGANHFVIRDDGETITPAAGCTTWAATPGYLTCPAAGINSWRLSLSSGNDVLDTNEFGGLIATQMTIAGGPGSDDLAGGRGADVLDGGIGADILRGSSGNDIVSYADRTASQPVGVNITTQGSDDGGLEDGPVGSRDTLTLVEGAIGGAGNDRLTAERFGDPVVFDGGPGNDALTGSTRNDTFRGGAGADNIVGNSGTDTVLYDDHADGVAVSLSAGSGDDGNATDGAPGARDTTSTVENLTGTNGDDVLFGNNVENVILAGTGNDTVQGGLGTDVLRGDAGRDVVDYGDHTTAEPVSLSLDAARNDGAAGENDDIGADFEILGGSQGDDVLTTGVGGSELRGAGGNDRLVAASSGTTLAGGDGNDELTGGDGGDVIGGGVGDDRIDGRGGSDTVFGDDGNDFIESRDGIGEPVNCGTGVDTALADLSDQKVDCELPAPPPPPPPPPPKVLRLMAVSLTFDFFPRNPRRTTRFEKFRIASVPAGSTVVARCLTKKNKRCKGKLGKTFTKKKARGSFVIKRFNNKYRAPRKLEIVISHPDFVTQIKTVSIRKNKRPRTTTRCRQPGSSKRTRCGL